MSDNNIWSCPDCGHSVHRNPAAAGSEEWTEQFIATHEHLHAQQLKEHRGDDSGLRNRLRKPALHAALERLNQKAGEQ